MAYRRKSNDYILMDSNNRRVKINLRRYIDSTYISRKGPLNKDA